MVDRVLIPRVLELILRTWRCQLLECEAKLLTLVIRKVVSIKEFRRIVILKQMVITEMESHSTLWVIYATEPLVFSTQKSQINSQTNKMTMKKSKP
jgi:hypothetical protein